MHRDCDTKCQPISALASSDFGMFWLVKRKQEGSFPRSRDSRIGRGRDLNNFRYFPMRLIQNFKAKV